MEKLLRDKKAIVIFIAPALILFTLILMIPIIMSVYYSFCQWNALTPPKFIGLGNYIDLFKDDSVILAFKNTLFFVVVSLITQQVFGLFLAVILSNIVKGRNLYKNIVYLPAVLSSTAVGLMFCFLFNEKMGINVLLKMIGINGPQWLSATGGFIPLPMWVIGAVACWQYVGTTMLLYMAGIAGIDKSLYEAAEIDGATKTEAFVHITLPLIRPMAKITIVLTCVGSFKIFDLIWNMTGGGPDHITESIATYLYQSAFKWFKYGSASAMSMILLVLCLIATFVVDIIFKKDDSYEM